ncbi:MAG: tetraacyldisaccharide 4-kinase [Candidatus Angelobacter sp.]|jgi:tetraacyldisaccharide 4'-kinase|nr:tetraacyldisaccharide 4-kinase [Candidatus Angelobacter sp.]
MSALTPLSAVFGAGVAARNALYDSGVLKTQRLKWPVVSVGNLSVGGTGKTPFTIMLGEMLQARKIAFDILSRGYGRKSGGIRLVDEKGSAAEFGDEPLLMARKLGVPVIVGAERFAAGLFSETQFSGLRPAHGGTWLHLLDDGFQHRRLHRDFDIVIVPPEDVRDRLLPAGRLREPISSLRRAQAIVLTEGASIEGLPIENQNVWRVTRRIDVTGVPSRPIAICGIARPERFLNDLRAAGIEIADEAIFPDHHAYTESDLRELLRLREQKNAGGFVTSEKDAINLAQNPPELLKSVQPLTAVPLKMELIDGDRALDSMLGVIAESLQCHVTG